MSLFLICFIFTFAYSATVDITVDLTNITNPSISKYIFGVNAIPYSSDANTKYTMVRSGGEGQTRYNWKIGAYDSARDWYFISNPSYSWQASTQPTINNNMDLLIQIPAMGWISKTHDKVWSFSQSKYGAQQKNECSDQPSGCTWCASDAGNGILTNGKQITGNDPTDASERVYPNNGSEWVSALIDAYGINRAKYYSIDNEPQLFYQIHFDVHPNGTTYDETWNMFKNYASAIKQNKDCNNECKLMGPSSWGWCGYFTSGYDSQAGQCIDGTDRQAHGNTPLLQWYLQQAAAFEKTNGYRLLDILDVHYYPQASGVYGNCDEGSTVNNRLQAARSLYDWSYTDPSWINQPIALIPRLKQWISSSYPGTNVSISEYNFGDETCLSSALAHAEVLAVCATYGVEIATRWTQPTPGTLVTNSYNLFTNYDKNGANIHGSNGNNIAYNTQTNNIEMVTGYTFQENDKSKTYVYLFNKDTQTSTVNVAFKNGNLSIQKVALYTLSSNGLSYTGDASNINSSGFTVSVDKWNVVLAVVS